LTLIERISRLTLPALLKSKTAEATNRLLRAIFRRLPQLARRSITFDNGSEFARHQNLSQTLDMKTWQPVISPAIGAAGDPGLS
jgi:IS30 family transposase